MTLKVGVAGNTSVISCAKLLRHRTNALSSVTVEIYVKYHCIDSFCVKNIFELICSRAQGQFMLKSLSIPWGDKLTVMFLAS